MANLNKLNWPYNEQVLNIKQSNRAYYSNPTVFKPGNPIFDKAGTYLMPGENFHPNMSKQLLKTNNIETFFNKNKPINNINMKINQQLKFKK